MHISTRDAIEPYVTLDGSTIRELLHPAHATLPSPLHRQSLAEATVEPGASTQEHYHRTSEEVYYIVQGCGLMRIDDEEHAVQPGDAVAIAAGQRHAIRNTGAGPLVFLCSCAPPYSHEDTVVTGASTRYR